MLEVSGVTVVYGPQKALDDVSLRVEAGDAVGIVGPLGAGKSTLFRAILNIVSPSSGTVALNGEPLSSLPCSEIGYRDESPFQFDFFTPREALLFERALRDPQLPEKRVSESLHEFDLDAYEDTPLDELSEGLRNRVALAATFMSQPALIILDEPLNTIDMSTALILKRLIRQAVSRGAHVLISGHALPLLDEFVDKVIFLDHGSVLRSSPGNAGRVGDTYQNLLATNDSKAALSSLVQRFRR